MDTLHDDSSTYTNLAILFGLTMALVGVVVAMGAYVQIFLTFVCCLRRERKIGDEKIAEDLSLNEMGIKSRSMKENSPQGPSIIYLQEN